MNEFVLGSTILPSESPTPTAASMAHPDHTTAVCLVYDFYQAQFTLKNVDFPLRATDLELDQTIRQSPDYRRISGTLIEHGQLHLAESHERISAQLQAFLPGLQPPFGQTSFNTLSDHFFSEGINWNLILTYFVFTSELAYQANLQRLASVKDVASWQVQYISQHVIPWITQNGGWNGLVTHFTTLAQEHLPADEADHNLHRFAGVGAAALGFLSLGLFLSTR